MDLRSSMDGSMGHGFSPGQLLLGKYRIEQVIGQGGMGLVLGAIHVELQHHVAIKVLLPIGVGSDVIEARFLREAQIAASLRTENVVRVFDVGRLEDNRPYMVMEWLEGRDLATGPIGANLPLEEAIDYVVQACDAMAQAHARNLVHRDLKPANLFLVHDEHGVPTIKVLDFGISKIRHESQNLALTEANGLMGSPLYMSPEQVRSARDVDARADIWSLGTILFELVAGIPPFDGETLGAVFIAVTQAAPRSLREIRPEVPAELEAVILRCLAKEPDQRFQRAQDLQLALLPFASSRSQAKMAMRSSSAPPRLPGLSTAPSPAVVAATSRTTGGWADEAPTDQKRRSRRHWVVAACGLGSLIVGSVGWLWFARREPTPPPTAMLSASPTQLSAVAAASIPLAPASADTLLVPTATSSPIALASSEAAPRNDTLRRVGNLAKRSVTATNSSAAAAPPMASPAPAQPPLVQSPAPHAALPAVSTKPAPLPRKNPLDIQFK